MKKIIILNKKEGETPLSALENFRKKNSKYLNMPMTYAGRLDPMASGVLIILVGEEIKNKDKYLSLDKEYNFSVLFGFCTDTYDILGKVLTARQQAFFARQMNFFCDSLPLKEAWGTRRLEKLHLPRYDSFVSLVKDNLNYFMGKIKQKYPIYSSKTVNGKPLFSYARAGQDVEIPEREIFTKKLALEKIKITNNKKLFFNIESRIKKVKGDFRQKEILKIWESNLKKPQKFYIADFKIKCTSGTYVRGLANSLGEKMGIPALAFSIKRTKIGKWK